MGEATGSVDRCVLWVNLEDEARFGVTRDYRRTLTSDNPKLLFFVFVFLLCWSNSSTGFFFFCLYTLFTVNYLFPFEKN